MCHGRRTFMDPSLLGFGFLALSRSLARCRSEQGLMRSLCSKLDEVLIRPSKKGLQDVEHVDCIEDSPLLKSIVGTIEEYEQKIEADFLFSNQSHHALLQGRSLMPCFGQQYWHIEIATVFFLLCTLYAWYKRTELRSSCMYRLYRPWLENTRRHHQYLAAP